MSRTLLLIAATVFFAVLARDIAFPAVTLVLMGLLRQSLVLSGRGGLA